MKTITIIIATILSLQISSLFAGADNPPLYPFNSDNITICIALDPTTPGEANFDEVIIISGFDMLAPVTPKEAGFDEIFNFSQAQILKILAPVAPKTAGFDDDSIPVSDLKVLAPTTPAEADFE